MNEVRGLMADLVSLSLEKIGDLLEKIQVTVEEIPIGGKVEVKLHESSEEFPKRVLGKSRSDSKENALKAALYEAWAGDHNDIRNRLLAAV